MATQFLAVFAFSVGIIAQATNFNPSGYGCIEPQGFVDCINEQETALQTCLTEIQKSSECMKSTKCTQACIDRQMASNIGCWVQSCWNMRNSCRYQQTALQYISHHGLVYSPEGGQVPFFPAPEDADGGCSCNLGYVYGNQTVNDDRNLCLQHATDSRENVATCGCCDSSWRLNYIHDTCPHGDLTTLNIENTVFLAQQKASSAGSAGSNDCSFLSTSPETCDAFGFEQMPENNTWMDPFNLPSEFPGTTLMTDAVATISDFGLASTTVVLLPAYTSVITPVAWNAENVASPTSATSGVTAVETGAAVATGSAVESASGTASGSASGSAGSGNGGASMKPQGISVVILSISAVFMSTIWM